MSRKANPPAVPPRAPVRDVVQKKLHEVNQERTQTKSAPQSKPFTNAEPLRVTIVDTYPDKLQPLHPAKKLIFFQPIRSENLTVTPKIGKLPKIDLKR